MSAFPSAWAVDVPAPQIAGELVAPVPQKCVSELTHIVDTPVLQFEGEIVAPVPPFREETGEVLQLIPRQHAHFGGEPFEKDGRKYFDCEDSKDSIKNQPLTHEQTIDQPGDQVRRDPADSIRRQGCRYACGDAEDGGSLAGAVRRQSGGCACDHACDHAGAPGPHVAAKDTLQELISEPTQSAADMPVPQILETVPHSPQLPSLFGPTSAAGQAGLASMPRQAVAGSGTRGTRVSTSLG